MRDASGLGIRLAADLEPGLFDLDDQIAGEAGLDAQGASHPLPAVDILSAPILAKGTRDSGTRWFSRLS
jgi:hypothetical protein